MFFKPYGKQQWIPAHSGIAENEDVDAMAKNAAHSL